MKRRRTLLIAAIGLIALAIAVPALAGVGPIPVQSKGKSHGVHYLAGTFDDEIGGSIQISGDCEDGNEILGGGASWRGPAKRTRLAGSSADYGFMADQSHWEAEGIYKGSNPPFTVHVICSARNPIVASNGREVLQNTKGTVTATCPKGYSVSGGGGALFQGYLSQSMPIDSADDADLRQDDGWRATGRAFDADTLLSVTAVCIEAEPGELKVLRIRGDAESKHAKTLGKSCPKGKAVTGGGVDASASGKTEWISSMRPADTKADPNKTPDDRYASTVYNNSGRKRSISAYTICLG